MYVAALIFCPVTVPLVAVRLVGPRWGHSVPPCCLARRASTPERGNVKRLSRAKGLPCGLPVPLARAPPGALSSRRRSSAPRSAGSSLRPTARAKAAQRAGRKSAAPCLRLRSSLAAGPLSVAVPTGLPLLLVRRGLSLRRSAPSLRVRVPRPRRKVTVRVSGGLRLRARAKAALNAGRKSAAPCAPLRRPLYSI